MATIVIIKVNMLEDQHQKDTRYHTSIIAQNKLMTQQMDELIKHLTKLPQQIRGMLETFHKTVYALPYKLMSSV